MTAIPVLLLFLALHGVFFFDVAIGDRSLSAASLTAGLTPHGPIDAPPSRESAHVLDVEGAAWVDEPSPYLAHNAFTAGELPLWNPGTGFGAPLAANLNSGAGNLLQLPLNLLPSARHADLFYLGRLLLLAWFTWAFLRELGLTTLAAFLGATVVAYGGYPMAWIVHHPLSSELFLPLMLLGFERGRRGRTGGWMLLVAAVAGSLLGGKLQASLLCCGFVTAYAIVRAEPKEGGAGWWTPAVTVAAVALGSAVAAYLLAPAFESMRLASGLTLGGRTQLAGFTVPWSSLASLMVPTLFAAPGRAFADGLLTPGIGIAAVALAGVGAMARHAPLVRVAQLGACWATIFLLRNAGAFGDLAMRLPVLGGILFLKYTFSVVFALALAGAIGFDAILAGRIEGGRARAVIVAVLIGTVVLAAAAMTIGTMPTFMDRSGMPLAVGGVLLAVTGLWRWRIVERGGIAVLLLLLVIAELWLAAPHRHPPRLDPYRAPAYVDFLKGAAPGRIIADPDVLVPLTSAAAGLADVRAIDVLTPGAYYAYFTRLVSFCDRVIHFTVDPDVILAATAPALDLAGVRWIVTRAGVPAADVALRVRRQVGRERTARLLAGMVRLRTAGGPLGIGPVAIGDDDRFAFTLTTPFSFDVTAESVASELAFGVLVRGTASTATLHVAVDGVPSDAPTEAVVVPPAERWVEQRIALARAGEQRRVRLLIRADTTDGLPAQVSLGNLGFGPGEVVEARLATERTTRQLAETSAIRPAFDDPANGVTVYENANALPRAFRVRGVEPTGSEDAALTRLGDGFDFRRVALVPQSDVAAVQAALVAGGSRADDAASSSATITTETPGSVTIATAGPTAAVVVLADLAYPGWRVEVDGHSAPVLTVDGVFRGVVVPAGAHVVLFHYRPTSWLVGIVLSVLGLIAMVPYAHASARLHAHGDPR